MTATPPPFQSLDDFRTLLSAAPGPDADARAGAEARNAALTKPEGALGRLEDLALWYAGWRGTVRPRIEHPQIAVFAGNHGVAARGVSAYPAAVTAQMAANFRAGGAAINQLAGVAGAAISIHEIELDRPTADFTQGPAMSEEELLAALSIGWAAVDPQADLLVVGEMGIANITAAAALTLALFGGTAEDWTGSGTGVHGAALEGKTKVVAAGLATHPGATTDPLLALRSLGGREIAAMTGALAAARAFRIPVILDGFICCAAAGVLHRLQPGALDHAQAGHLSAEAGHDRILKALSKEPMLSLRMRLGEGTGAALAINILKGALACHSGMASFAEAGVSTKG